jgi:hypothetical protein
MKMDPKKRILKLNGYYLKGPQIEDDLEDDNISINETNEL